MIRPLPPPHRAPTPRQGAADDAAGVTRTTTRSLAAEWRAARSQSDADADPSEVKSGLLLTDQAGLARAHPGPTSLAGEDETRAPTPQTDGGDLDPRARGTDDEPLEAILAGAIDAQPPEARSGF